MNPFLWLLGISIINGVWPPWQASFRTSKDVSHGEVELVNKYFSISFLSICFSKSEPSSRVDTRSEVSHSDRAKGPCSFLQRLETTQVQATGGDRDRPSGHWEAKTKHNSF
jgi:hypothetical protein